jgi:MOSC domain-containing protein YiiM
VARVVSVNVGAPQTIRWEGRDIRSGIRKTPRPGRVALRGVNLVGDDQADRTVHGGSRKSVYVYPSEHYPYWTAELSGSRLEWGSFGENLTTEGWLERDAHIGDLVRIGSAEFEVTQPRRPCFKLNATFARADMIERFHRSGRSGFYLGARRDGEVGAGDPIELLSRPAGAVSIFEALKPSQPEARE